MDADGDNLEVIASDPELCQGDPSYTPDGSRLVYVRFDPALDVEQIWSMKIDGSDQRFVTGVGGPDPNVSPDGRKISFKGNPDGALFVANIDGSGAVQISPSISVTYKHDWAPDGQHLIVSDNSEPAPDEAVNVVTVRPDGSDWTLPDALPGWVPRQRRRLLAGWPVDRLPSGSPGPGADDVPDPARRVGPARDLRVVDRDPAVHRLGAGSAATEGLVSCRNRERERALRPLPLSLWRTSGGRWLP